MHCSSHVRWRQQTPRTRIDEPRVDMQLCCDPHGAPPRTPQKAQALKSLVTLQLHACARQCVWTPPPGVSCC
eukprot:5177210-Amphidinium_carterae.1